MVKNEEKYLEECLIALQPLLKEIQSELIVVDTGSEDKTVEIAKKYTEKVYFHKWNNNFSEIRNVTINYSSGEWILIIDGDEILQNHSPIVEFLKSKEKTSGFNHALITVKNIHNLNNLDDSSLFLSPRLFRNDGTFHFKGAVHNQPIYKGPGLELNSSLVHYGYLSTDKELMEKKYKRTAALLKSELEKDPNNIYYWYQLSVTYGMHQDHDKAVEPIEKGYKLIKDNNLNPENFMYVYLQLVKVYINNKQIQDAEKICYEALELKDGYIDLYFYLAKIKQVKRENNKAIEYFLKYLEMVRDYNQSPGKRDISIIHYTLNRYEEAYKDLVILYEVKEENDNAYHFYKKLTSPQKIQSIFKHIFNILVKLKRYSEVQYFYETNILSESEDVIRAFEIFVENSKALLVHEDKHQLVEAFSEGKGLYGLLNKIRVFEQDNLLYIDKEIIDKVYSIDFNNVHVFYSEIIFALFKRKYDVLPILKSITYNNSAILFEYLIKKYKNYSDVINEYIGIREPMELMEYRVFKTILRYALIQDNLDNINYRVLFDKYLDYGIKHLQNVYSNEILCNEIITELKNDEETFLLYIYLGFVVKKQSLSEYIKYLGKALNVYPLKRGIELLLEEVQEEIKPKSETQHLKEKFLSQITLLIDKGQYLDAEKIVSEYTEIFPNDLEILAVKTKLSIYKSNIIES